MDTINVDERNPGMTTKELREARRSNRIPAAIYGKDVPSLSVFLKTPGGKVKELKMGKHLKVKVGGKTLQATVDEVQKDPVTNAPTHISLHAVSSEQVMKVEVPVTITGEAKGQKNNGIITQFKNTLALKGKFSDLPEEVSVDISNLDVNEKVSLKDLNLPKNVEILEEDMEQGVVSCSYSNVSMEAAPEEEPTEETATKASTSGAVGASEEETDLNA